MPPADNNVLQVLYENHARELNAFARQRVGGDEAGDVVHDTYVRVLQYADPGALENPRAYLYRVAANVASDRGAALKSCSERFDTDVEPDSVHAETPGPEAVIAARQRLQHCLAALGELPDIYRHVFLLHRIDGMAQAEIASALDIPKRTVERYIAKTLEHCLKRVGPGRV